MSPENAPVRRFYRMRNPDNLMNSMTNRQAVRTGTRTTVQALFFVAAAALVCVCLGSCGRTGGNSSAVLVYFDQAFVEIFPEYCAEISENYAIRPADSNRPGGPGGGGLPGGQPPGQSAGPAESRAGQNHGGKPDVAPLSSIDQALEKKLAALGATGRHPTIVVTSPLLAQAYAAARTHPRASGAAPTVDQSAPPSAKIGAANTGDITTGSAPSGAAISLIVPFSHDMRDLTEERPQTISARSFSVGYDYETAYRAMGDKAGQIVKKAAGAGLPAAACSIVFQENFMRRKEALDAFAEAYEAAAGVDRLDIRYFGSDYSTVDIIGALQSSLLEIDRKRTKVIVCAIDDAALSAETARTKPAGLTVMADMSGWGNVKLEGGLFDYSLQGDDRAMAAATAKLVDALLGGKTPPSHTLVPLRH